MKFINTRSISDLSDLWVSLVDSSGDSNNHYLTVFRQGIDFVGMTMHGAC